MTRRARAIITLVAYTLALPFLLHHAFGWLQTSADASHAARGVWGDPHIGVVADTTASMGPALDALAAAWQMDDAYPPLTATFRLVGFKDEPTYLGSTMSQDQFGAWLDGLQAKGGGDCVDNALAGLLEMARRTPPGITPAAQVLLATDATPRGGRTAFAYVADRLLQRGLRVNALINGWCPNPPISPIAVGFLAMATGGEYIPTDAGNYVTDTLITLNKMAASDRLMGFRGTVEPGNPDIFAFEVDGTMTTLGVDDDDYYNCLTCILRLPTMNTAVVRSPESITVEVRAPNGMVIGPGTAGYQLLVNDYRRFQALNPPGQSVPTGTWTIRVTGDGVYNLDIVADSGLHLVYPGEHTLPVGRPNRFQAALINELGSPGLVTTATFSLVSMDGQQTLPIQLFDDGQHNDGAAGDGLYGGAVRRNQQGCWRLAVQGALADGTAFQRLYPAPIRFRGFRLARPLPGSAVPGTTRQVNFTLVNGGTLEGGQVTTFDLGVFSEQGWAVTDTVPVSITLQPGEVYDVVVPVEIPAGALPGATEEVTLVAAPVNDIGLSTSATGSLDVVAEILSYLPVIARP